MAITEIIAKIEHDATTLSEGVREAARYEARTLLEKADEEAENAARSGRDDAARAASKTRGRIIANATHEAKFAIQAFRASLIERTFEETETLLSQLSKEEYRAFIKSRAASLPDHPGVLTLAPEREEETRAALKEAHRATHDIRIARANDLMGGFILETGSAVYDISLRALMADARERYPGDVARKLFAASR